MAQIVLKLFTVGRHSAGKQRQHGDPGGSAPFLQLGITIPVIMDDDCNTILEPPLVSFYHLTRCLDRTLLLVLKRRAKDQ